MSEDKLPKAVSGDPGGALGETDDDLLRRAAREIRASTSLQALVPLSSSEREQLADAAIERVLGVAALPVPSSEPVSSGPAASSTPAPGVPAKVVPMLRPRFGPRSVGAVVAATLALAAAVVLYVRAGRGTVEPLGAYAMAVRGEQAVRGAAEPGTRDEPVKLHPETRLVITLTPGKPERDVRYRLVLVRDGHATLLEPVEKRQAGTIEIAGPAAELLAAQVDGPADLVVVLGRELPGDAEIRVLALRSSDPAPRHLQVMRQPVLLEGFSHTAIDVLLGGCSAVLGGAGVRGEELPRCEVAAGASLQLWVGVPARTALAIVFDDRALEHNAQARGGGSAFDVDVPARTGRLSVRMGAREIAAWQIAPAAMFENIRASDEARRAGRLDEADAGLEAIAAQLSAAEQLEAVRLRAKIALRRGDVSAERTWRDQAIRLARPLGRVSVEIDETAAMIHGFIDEHAVVQAAQLLRALDAHGMIYAEGAMDRAFLHGRLASELGDLGAALGSFQRSLAIAGRVRDATGRAILLGPLADVLQSLGRGSDARAFIEEELQRGQQDGAQGSDVCAHVNALTNAGWLLRDIDPPRAQQLVDHAAILARERCKLQLPIALVNQGWLLAAAGRFGEARAVLDQFARGQVTPDARIKTWVLRLEAETVLGEDPARAEQHAQRLAARATELCSTELLYEARLLRARALVLLDRREQAAAAFAEAERALTLWSHLVPLGEGRATFFQRHDQLALTAIPFFLEQVKRGQPGARLALAATLRHSIARFVTSLARGGRERARAERGETDRDRTSKQFEQTLDRWPASLGAKDRPGEAVAGVCAVRDAEARVEDEPRLSEPPPQAALFVHPAPQGLLVLAWRGSSIDVRQIPRAGALEGPEAIADRIATAAAPLLAGVPHVRLSVHRSLAALPLDRRLAERLGVPVSFAVDARVRPPGASCDGRRRALLVTNPQQNLSAASRSAPMIRSNLERMGFVVDALDGPAATRAAIFTRLVDPCTALFHYDGHGIAASERGTPGGDAGGAPGDRVDDALVLAGGDLLTAAAVLDLPRVPAAVVLNGCTTAAREGLGLAQAFVLAGAGQVVASLDEISAGDAARFTKTLFDGAPPRAPGVDLVRLFFRAMSGSDIPALRAFER